MLSVATYLNSLNCSTQLETVKNLIDSAQAKTTFWGSRVVEVNGFTGSVYLEDIADKVLKASEERVDADDLTLKERIMGIGVVRKLVGFYQVTDAEIQDSNFLTRFLNWIREFSFVPYTTRFYIEEIAEKYFRGFSEVKFLQQFGSWFGAIDEHPAYSGSFGPPQRIVAGEKQIRALLNHV